MTSYEDEMRVDGIQQKVHAYVKSMNDTTLMEAWLHRRDLVADKRLSRAKVREELKEDLLWLVGYVEERVRQGAGTGALRKEQAAMKMIVEVL